MRALLLAAGLGTRLRPLTNSIPKCLVDIHGRPLLDYWLDLLLGSRRFERVLINTHYFADTVERHVASSPWRDRIETVFEPELLGTGGTILANRAFLDGGDFLVAHADNLTDFDLAGFVAAHEGRPAGIRMTMLSFHTDAPRTCGILELDDRGIVQAFHEKVENPPGNLANGAVYMMEPSLIETIAALGKPVVDLSTEIIPGLVRKTLAVDLARYHRDIGTMESLELARREFRAPSPSPRVS